MGEEGGGRHSDAKSLRAPPCHPPSTREGTNHLQLLPNPELHKISPFLLLYRVEN